MSSDFNLQRINTKELTDNIAATIEFGGNLFAIAKRGSGKTSITRQVIAASKYKEVYFNLSLMERPDLGGYPNFHGSSKDKFIHFLMPSIYKDLMEGSQPCVAVFDEVDKAESGLLAPLLEIIQERSINGTKLKNLHAIIMTGNLQAEGGSRPPLPLLDRTEKFFVEVNPKHWLDWAAISGEIHPSVTAYISDNLDDLSGEIDPGEAYSGPSPRGWHNASKLLIFGEKHKWNHHMMLHKVAACVGKRVGVKYATFFEHYQILLPIVDKIIQGHKVSEIKDFEETKKLIVSMILCARFAKMLDGIKSEYPSGTNNFVMSKDISNIGNNIVNFLLNDIDPEISLISIRGQIGSSRVMEFNLIDDPIWDKIISELLTKIKG